MREHDQQSEIFSVTKSMGKYLYNGKIYTLQKLCDELNVNINIFRNRYYIKGLSIEDALKAARRIQPKKTRRRLSQPKKDVISSLKNEIQNFRTEQRELNKKYFDLKSKLLLNEKEQKKELKIWFNLLKSEITKKRRDSINNLKSHLGIN